VQRLFTSRILAALAALAVFLMLAAVACGDSDTPAPTAKETIVFSDLSWDSAQLQNRIAIYIVENGYGYPVDAILGDTIALQTGLINGDTQVMMEV